VDEQEVVDRVAERPENDCLIFLKGRVKAFALFLTAFLIDVALAEIDDLVNVVSADLAIVKNSDDLPLMIQSIYSASEPFFNILLFSLGGLLAQCHWSREGVANCSVSIGNQNGWVGHCLEGLCNPISGTGNF